MLIALLIAQSDIDAAANFPIYDGRNEEAERLMQPYVECAFQAAGKLERSGEAADIVARAAIDFCVQSREALEVEVDSARVIAGSTGGDPLEAFDEWLVRQLSLRIVGKRAMAKQ